MDNDTTWHQQHAGASGFGDRLADFAGWNK